MSRKNLEDKLTQAGFDVKYRNYGLGELKLQHCPLHRDKTPSLTINVDNKKFKCQSCGFSGSVGKLLNHFGIHYYFGVSAPTLSELEELFLEINRDPSDLDTDDEVCYDVGELRNYKYWHPYLETRGIDKKFAKENLIGFDKKTARVTIPIFFNGKYYGCAKRSIFAETVPKISYEESFPKDKIIYICPSYKGLSDSLLVVEGPIDCLIPTKYGQDTAATFSAEFSPLQVKLIEQLANGRQIILGFDQDAAGRKAVDKFLNFCYNPLEVKIFNYKKEEIKDPGMLNQESLDYGIANAMWSFEI